MVAETAKPRWAKRISDLRLKLGMNQQAFAAALSTAQGNVSKWESGDHKPTPDMLTRIAALAPDVDKFFFLEEAGIPSSFFMGEMDKSAPREMVKAAEAVVARVTTPEGERKIDIVMVPVLADAAAAGNPRTINERDVEQIIPMLASWLPRGGNVYGIHVSGDSMIPVLREGDIVLIDVARRDPRKLVDKMVAARVSDGVTIKWLRSYKKFYMLVPQNTAVRHPVRVLEPSDDWGIVGEVVRWIGYPAQSKRK